MSDNLVLDLLRAIRADTEAIRRVQAEHGSRLASLEIALARVRRDMGSDAEHVAEQGQRMDTLSQRIERLEQRLDLRDH